MGRRHVVHVLLLPVITLLLGFLWSHSGDKSHGAVESYPKHLTGAYTGGFGEPTCRNCHFDYDLNPEGGSLEVAGIPHSFEAGEKYEIVITVKREKLGRAGFQLSARSPDGRQAGKFIIDGSNRVILSDATPDSLQYVQHSKKGSDPAAPNKNSWTVNWQAPTVLPDTVLFHVAGNAANGDQSEFGDLIYSTEIVSVADTSACRQQ